MPYPQLRYHPFGMLMPGRIYTSNTYRYGFNGKEKDDEAKGIAGSQQDYGFRIYDPRMAKFLSVDPLTSKYAMLTPYQFASNTPIACIDLDGLEAYVVYIDNYFGRSEPQISIIFDQNIKRAAGDYWLVYRNFDNSKILNSATVGAGSFEDAQNYFQRKIVYDYLGWSLIGKAKIIGGTIAEEESFLGEGIGGSVGLDATLIGVEKSSEGWQYKGVGQTDEWTFDLHAEAKLGSVQGKISQEFTDGLDPRKVTAEFGISHFKMGCGSDFSLTVEATVGNKTAVGLGWDAEVGIQWRWQGSVSYSANSEYYKPQCELPVFMEEKLESPDITKKFEQ